MIKTIEIAPDIVAAELAKYLYKKQYDFIDWGTFGGIREEVLREIIRDFLNGT